LLNGDTDTSVQYVNNSTYLRRKISFGKVQWLVEPEYFLDQAGKGIQE